ncbi:MAG: hypothetical protein HKN23_02780 [Verrucomicrobiales bacterium]|nr:hypothetical protein [Verrucomicrobiales bacterium]
MAIPDSTNPKKSESTAIWFLRKLVTTPATWIGLLTGSAAGIALAQKGPLGGSIGFGIISGVAAAVVIAGLTRAIQHSHKVSKNRDLVNPLERDLVGELRKTGLEEDARLLESMLDDRDAVLKRCQNREEDPDARHTAELVSSIIQATCRRAGELQDLSRRVNDPILESPPGAEESIELIREDLKRAYRAVADARSRLRRGNRLTEPDFLADEKSMGSLDLDGLTSRLEEETAISKRIENRIVMEDSRDSTVDSSDPERESN